MSSNQTRIIVRRTMVGQQRTSLQLRQRQLPSWWLRTERRQLHTQQPRILPREVSQLGVPSSTILVPLRLHEWAPTSMHRRPLSIWSTTYWMDKVLQRPNPLLDLIHNPDLEINAKGDEATQHRQQGNLSLNRIEPFHASTAMEHVLDCYEQQLVAAADTIPQQEQDTRLLGLAQERVDRLQSLLGLMARVGSPQMAPQWQKAYDAMQEKRQDVERTHLEILLSSTFAGGKSTMPPSSSPLAWQAIQQQLYVTTHKEKSGIRTLDATEEGSTSDNKQRFAQLSRVVQQASIELSAVKFPSAELGTRTSTLGAIQSFPASPSQAKPLVKAFYTWVGAATERAQLLGYEHLADQYVGGGSDGATAVRRRIANRAEIEALHTEVAKGLLAHHRRERGESDTPLPKSNSLGALNDMMRPTEYIQRQSSVLAPHELAARQDRRSQLRLEHCVSLEGALNFLSRLTKEILGIELVAVDAEDSTSSTDQLGLWSEDVRLYHAYDVINDGEERKYMGSFFLDPYQRAGKTTDNGVLHLNIPIRREFPDGSSPVVVAALILNSEPPAWDNEASMLTWSDVEYLFHEMGHIFQALAWASSYPRSSSSPLRPDLVPLDVVEIMPKFMEHWLLEESTLYGLIHSSEYDPTTVPQEAYEAAYRVLSRRKAQELALQTYYGKLELELLSDFLKDNQKESIIGIQQRLAEELLDDGGAGSQNTAKPNMGSVELGPLLYVLQANATEHELVAMYRYLWADAIGAHIFKVCKEAYERANQQTETGNERDEILAELRKKLRKTLLAPDAMYDGSIIREEWNIGDHVSPTTLLERYELAR